MNEKFWDLKKSKQDLSIKEITRIDTGKNKANKSDYELNDDHYPHHVHHNVASDAQTSAPVCPAP